MLGGGTKDDLEADFLSEERELYTDLKVTTDHDDLLVLLGNIQRHFTEGLRIQHQRWIKRNSVLSAPGSPASRKTSSSSLVGGSSSGTGSSSNGGIRTTPMGIGCKADGSSSGMPTVIIADESDVDIVAVPDESDTPSSAKPSTRVSAPTMSRSRGGSAVSSSPRAGGGAGSSSDSTTPGMRKATSMIDFGKPGAGKAMMNATLTKSYTVDYSPRDSQVIVPPMNVRTKLGSFRMDYFCDLKFVKKIFVRYLSSDNPVLAHVTARTLGVLFAHQYLTRDALMDLAELLLGVHESTNPMENVSLIYRPFRSGTLVGGFQPFGLNQGPPTSSDDSGSESSSVYMTSSSDLGSDSGSGSDSDSAGIDLLDKIDARLGGKLMKVASPKIGAPRRGLGAGSGSGSSSSSSSSSSEFDSASVRRKFVSDSPVDSETEREMARHERSDSEFHRFQPATKHRGIRAGDTMLDALDETGPSTSTSTAALTMSAGFDRKKSKSAKKASLLSVSSNKTRESIDSSISDLSTFDSNLSDDDRHYRAKLVDPPSTIEEEERTASPPPTKGPGIAIGIGGALKPRIPLVDYPSTPRSSSGDASDGSLDSVGSLDSISMIRQDSAKAPSLKSVGSSSIRKGREESSTAVTEMKSVDGDPNDEDNGRPIEDVISPVPSMTDDNPKSPTLRASLLRERDGPDSDEDDGDRGKDHHRRQPHKKKKSEIVFVDGDDGQSSDASTDVSSSSSSRHSSSLSIPDEDLARMRDEKRMRETPDAQSASKKVDFSIPASTLSDDLVSSKKDELMKQLPDSKPPVKHEPSGTEYMDMENASNSSDRSSSSLSVSDSEEGSSSLSSSSSRRSSTGSNRRKKNKKRRRKGGSKSENQKQNKGSSKLNSKSASMMNVAKIPYTVVWNNRLYNAMKILAYLVSADEVSSDCVRGLDEWFEKIVLDLFRRCSKAGYGILEQFINLLKCLFLRFMDSKFLSSSSQPGSRPTSPATAPVSSTTTSASFSSSVTHSPYRLSLGGGKAGGPSSSDGPGKKGGSKSKLGSSSNNISSVAISRTGKVLAKNVDRIMDIVTNDVSTLITRQMALELLPLIANVCPEEMGDKFAQECLVILLEESRFNPFEMGLDDYNDGAMLSEDDPFRDDKSGTDGKGFRQTRTFKKSRDEKSGRVRMSAFDAENPFSRGVTVNDYMPTLLFSSKVEVFIDSEMIMRQTLTTVLKFMNRLARKLDEAERQLEERKLQARLAQERAQKKARGGPGSIYSMAAAAVASAGGSTGSRGPRHTTKARKPKARTSRSSSDAIAVSRRKTQPPSRSVKKPQLPALVSTGSGSDGDSDVSSSVQNGEASGTEIDTDADEEGAVTDSETAGGKNKKKKSVKVTGPGGGSSSASTTAGGRRKTTGDGISSGSKGKMKRKKDGSKLGSVSSMSKMRSSSALTDGEEDAAVMFEEGDQQIVERLEGEFDAILARKIRNFFNRDVESTISRILTLCQNDDSILIDVLYDLLKIENTLKRSNSRLSKRIRYLFDPFYLFARMIDQFNIDHTVVIDWLTSNDTAFLPYLISFCKRMQYNWYPTCASSELVNKVMCVLIRTRLHVRKLWNLDEFPYNPKALLRVMNDIEFCYQMEGGQIGDLKKSSKKGGGWADIGTVDSKTTSSLHSSKAGTDTEGASKSEMSKDERKAQRKKRRKKVAALKMLFSSQAKGTQVELTEEQKEILKQETLLNLDETLSGVSSAAADGGDARSPEIDEPIPSAESGTLVLDGEGDEKKDDSRGEKSSDKKSRKDRKKRSKKRRKKHGKVKISHLFQHGDSPSTAGDGSGAQGSSAVASVDGADDEDPDTPGVPKKKRRRKHKRSKKKRRDASAANGDDDDNDESGEDRSGRKVTFDSSADGASERVKTADGRSEGEGGLSTTKSPKKRVRFAGGFKPKHKKTVSKLERPHGVSGIAAMLAVKKDTGPKQEESEEQQSGVHNSDE